MAGMGWLSHPIVLVGDQTTPNSQTLNVFFSFWPCGGATPRLLGVVSATHNLLLGGG
jgi:hypothetical protein